MLIVPIKTGTGLNAREHFRARALRVRAERWAVAYLLTQQHKPDMPCSVRITRIAPSNGLDDDNLAGSLKAIRDEIAHWLGIDDKRRDIVRYVYAQQRGPWGVGIEFGEPMQEAEFRVRRMAKEMEKT